MSEQKLRRVPTIENNEDEIETLTSTIDLTRGGSKSGASSKIAWNSSKESSPSLFVSTLARISAASSSLTFLPPRIQPMPTSMAISTSPQHRCSTWPPAPI